MTAVLLVALALASLGLLSLVRRAPEIESRLRAASNRFRPPRALDAAEPPSQYEDDEFDDEDETVDAVFADEPEHPRLVTVVPEEDADDDVVDAVFDAEVAAEQAPDVVDAVFADDDAPSTELETKVGRPQLTPNQIRQQLGPFFGEPSAAPKSSASQERDREAGIPEVRNAARPQTLADFDEAAELAQMSDTDRFSPREQQHASNDRPKNHSLATGSNQVKPSSRDEQAASLNSAVGKPESDSSKSLHGDAQSLESLDAVARTADTRESLVAGVPNMPTTSASELVEDPDAAESTAELAAEPTSATGATVSTSAGVSADGPDTAAMSEPVEGMPADGSESATVERMGSKSTMPSDGPESATATGATVERMGRESTSAMSEPVEGMPADGSESATVERMGSKSTSASMPSNGPESATATATTVERMGPESTSASEPIEGMPADGSESATATATTVERMGPESTSASEPIEGMPADGSESATVERMGSKSTSASMPSNGPESATATEATVERMGSESTTETSATVERMGPESATATSALVPSELQPMPADDSESTSATSVRAERVDSESASTLPELVEPIHEVATGATGHDSDPAATSHPINDAGEPDDSAYDRGEGSTTGLQPPKPEASFEGLAPAETSTVAIDGVAELEFLGAPTPQLGFDYGPLWATILRGVPDMGRFLRDRYERMLGPGAASAVATRDDLCHVIDGRGPVMMSALVRPHSQGLEELVFAPYVTGGRLHVFRLEQVQEATGGLEAQLYGQLGAEFVRVLDGLYMPNRGSYVPGETLVLELAGLVRSLHPVAGQEGLSGLYSPNTPDNEPAQTGFYGQVKESVEIVFYGIPLVKYVVDLHGMRQTLTLFAHPYAASRELGCGEMISGEAWLLGSRPQVFSDVVYTRELAEAGGEAEVFAHAESLCAAHQVALRDCPVYCPTLLEQLCSVVESHPDARGIVGLLARALGELRMQAEEQASPVAVQRHFEILTRLQAAHPDLSILEVAIRLARGAQRNENVVRDSAVAVGEFLWDEQPTLPRAEH